MGKIPTEEARGRGRPSYKPTDSDRRLVSVLRGLGKPEQPIADALGISIKTLRKHFEYELAHGAVNLVGRTGACMGEVAQKTNHKEWFRAAKWIMSTVGGVTDDIKQATPQQVYAFARLFVGYVESCNPVLAAEFSNYLPGFGEWLDQRSGAALLLDQDSQSE